VNLQISQGSAATDLRENERFYSNFLQFILECKSEAIIKVGPCLSNSSQKDYVGVFFIHGVVILVASLAGTK